MRVNSHAGHGKQDSKSPGASKHLKESVENRIINNDFMAVMRQEGHTVHDITIDYPANQDDCLYKIVMLANSKNVDLDISFHFNSGRKDPNGDGKTGGVECWIYDDKGTSKPIAERICKEIAALGFTNRGVKYSKDYYYLRNTKAQAIIVEVCFVDDMDDYKRYQQVKRQIGKAVAQGVLNKRIEAPKPNNKVEECVKPIRIDGKVINCEVLMKNDRTYVKLRDFEKAGYKVDFVNNVATIDKP